MQPPVSQREVFQIRKHKFTTSLLFFLEPPGDCLSQTARGDQEAGRQRRGLPGSHPAPASQAAAAEGPRETWKSLPARPVEHDSNFTSCLIVHRAYRGPGGFSDTSGGAIPPRALGGQRGQLWPAPPPPPPRPGGTRAPSRRERIPTATAGQ